MKKKSISLLIAVAMATTMLPTTVAFADDQVAVTDTVTAPTEVTEAPASTYGVTFSSHIQNIGWEKTSKTVTGDQEDITKFTEAETSGTSGKSLRVEAVKIAGTNLPEGASIEYEVHQQNVGWSKTAAKDGEEAGVTGKSLRLEAIKITLKGMPGYAVKYQVHIQNKGWKQGAVVTENGTDIKDAAVAGTTGESLRVEAIRVQIVKTDAEKTAEVKAINTVALAEAAKDQASVDAAKAAVADVQDATIKADLTNKIDAIVIEEEVKDVTIKSAESLNGNQILVKFNKKVTGATTLSNYKLQNAKTGTAYLLSNDETSYATLSADGMSALITLGSTATNAFGINGLDTLDNVEYKLFIVNGNTIKDEDDVAIKGNTYVTFTGAIASDTEAPTVQTAKFISADKSISLNFNEKAYAIDPTKVTLTDGTNSFTLKASDAADVTTSGLAAKTIKYTITDEESLAALANLTGNVTVELADGAVKDVSGNESAATSIEATTTINPAVLAEGTSYDENTNKLTVKFNKVVDVKSLTDFTKITLANTSESLTSATITGDMTLETKSNSDTLVFALGTTAQEEMEKSAARANKDKYTIALAGDAIKDEDGAELATANTVALNYVKDEVAPTLQTATFENSSDTLTLKLSETVGIDSIDVSKIKISVNGGTSFSDLGTVGVASVSDINMVNGAQVTTPSDTITINNISLAEAINGAADKSKIIIQLDAAAFTDENSNTSEAAAYSATAADNKAISVAYENVLKPRLDANTSALSPSLIEVKFDKEMDESTLANVNNYSIVKVGNANITGTVKSVEVASDKKSAYLVLDAAIPTGSYKVTVSGVKDSVGNVIDENNNNITITVVADVNAPEISSVEYVDSDSSHSQSAGDKLIVTFSEPIKLEDTVSISDFTLSDSKVFGTGATVKAGSKLNQAVITLGTDSDIVLGETTINSVESANIKDLSGNSSAVGTAQKISIPSSETAPKIVSAKLTDTNGDGKVSTGDKITLTFDQNLQTKTDFHGADGAEGTVGLVFTNGSSGDGNVVAVASEVVTSGNTVTYTIATLTDGSNPITSVAKDAIKVNVTSRNANIVNAWGVSADDTADAVSLTVEDSNEAAPYLVSVTKNTDGKLEFKFSEKVIVDTAAQSDAFIIGANLTVANGTLAGSTTAVSYKANEDGTTDYTTIVVTPATSDGVDKFTTLVVGVKGITTVTDITGKTGVRNTVTPMNIIIA